MVQLEVIAHIYNGFDEKFGIPRQSGLADTVSTIVFEKPYRNPDALRGIEQFSHLWILWQFAKTGDEKWSPTVRPPRLGGNKRMGVFATRSPNRPNGIGLSSVKLLQVKNTENDGTVLVVSGADILNGTAIYDIKPYLAYSDSHPTAAGGFAAEQADYRLQVSVSPQAEGAVDEQTLSQICALLSCDPRPSYQNDPERVYGMRFAGYEVHFTVCDGTAYIKDITK